MRGLWTLVLVVCVVGPVWAGQRPVAGTVPGGLAQVAAICAGRLSAWREHQWLLDGAASERTAERLAAMMAILEAVVPPAEGGGARALRRDARELLVHVVRHDREETR